MYVENRTKSPIFTPPCISRPRWWGSPWNFVSAQGSQKTRAMGLSHGRKSFPIGLAVFIQYRSVTASHPASHVAVAITLNAKASSLKTDRITMRTAIILCHKHVNKHLAQDKSHNYRDWQNILEWRKERKYRPDGWFLELNPFFSRLICLNHNRCNVDIMTML